MVSEKDLRESSILSLIIRFSGPAIAGMVVMSIYNVVDRIYVGRGVGTLAIGGLAVCHPMMMIKASTAMLIGMGAAALISLRMGEGKGDEAETILGNAFTLLIGIGLAMSVAGFIFLEPLLRMFGASDNTLPYAISYMRVILIGNVFHMIGFGSNHLIRAEGNPRVAMLTMMASGVTNIILDPVFIFVLKMGVTGAAIATIIAQAVSAVWVLYYYIRGKSELKIRFHKMILNSPITTAILKLGTPNFLRTVINSSIMILLNNSLLHYGGDIAVATMGVIFSIHMMIMMPVFGVSQGAQPVIGFNYGARQFDRVKQSYFYSAGIATGLVSIGYLAIISFPGFFLGFFSTDPELIALGIKAIRIYMILLPLLGIQAIGANYFQATGRSSHSIFLNLTRQVIFLIPALLIIPRYVGLFGVWWAQPTADAFAFAVTFIFMVIELRNIEYKKRNSTVLQSV